MANGRAATAARRDPSSTTTREDAVNVWGRTIASQIAEGGQHLPEVPQPVAASDSSRCGTPLRPPAVGRLRRCASTGATRSSSARSPCRGGTPIPPSRSRGPRRRSTPSTAIRCGRSAPARSAWRCRTRLVPTSPVVRVVTSSLAADGPNFDEFGRQVEGKKGDTARDEKGQIKTELVDVEGMRRAPGVRVYYHRDDLNVPSLAARPLPSERAPDNVLASTVGSARRVHGLKVEETPDMAGRGGACSSAEGPPRSTGRS